MGETEAERNKLPKVTHTQALTPSPLPFVPLLPCSVIAVQQLIVHLDEDIDPSGPVMRGAKGQIHYGAFEPGGHILMIW